MLIRLLVIIHHSVLIEIEYGMKLTHIYTHVVTD